MLLEKNVQDTKQAITMNTHKKSVSQQPIKWLRAEKRHDDFTIEFIDELLIIIVTLSEFERSIPAQVNQSSNGEGHSKIE